ncbi:hypothetical protein ACQKWADRAFT_101725 [Trichoderma austrokoningii]
MASPILDRKLPVESYTDFQHPQSIKQSASVGSCSPAAFSPLPFSFEKGQQHHQPDTCSFTPAVCALPQQQRHQEVQCPQGGRVLSPPACCIEASAYMSPYSPYQPRRSIWPSPPSRPGETQYCLTLQELPAGGRASLLYHSISPTSPGGWSSPVSGYPPTSGYIHSQHPGDQPFDRVCTPMSAQELPLQHSDIHTPYTASFHHPDSDVDISTAFNLSVSSCKHAMPELSAVPASSSAGSPDCLQAETPASFISPKVEHVDGHDAEFMESILAAPRADEPITMSIARTDDKADEPYAKLIYKALMGQPDYTMTLQELYQWFRDHTSKAKNERGGWQNSIRHNLSMNAAFKRRDRKRGEGAASSACTEGESLLAGEVKRANEWILEDWAVRDGVQSTTRYRKGNSGRRSSRRSSSLLDMRINQRNSSVRALSGQKGGCAARNSRLRGHLYGQELPLADGCQYRLLDSGLGSPPATSSLVDTFYPMPIAIPRIDPTAIQTPIVQGHSNGTDFGTAAAAAATELFGLQMTGPRMDQQVAGGGNGHGGIHAVSYMGQQDQLYLEPSPAEFPYDIADVQLDYTVEHASIDVPEQIRRHNTIIGTPRIGWTSPNGV